MRNNSKGCNYCSQTSPEICKCGTFLYFRCFFLLRLMFCLVLLSLSAGYAPIKCRWPGLDTTLQKMLIRQLNMVVVLAPVTVPHCACGRERPRGCRTFRPGPLYIPFAFHYDDACNGTNTVYICMHDTAMHVYFLWIHLIPQHHTIKAVSRIYPASTPAIKKVDSI